MLGVCVFLGATLLTSIPAQRVALEYTHSLYDVPVYERYLVTPGALILEQYDSSTAVLEYYGMNPRPMSAYPEVRFIADDTGRHALSWAGGRLELARYGAAMRLRSCEINQVNSSQASSRVTA